MYLKTVFELEEAGIVPMRARIAERLGHSGPTVSQTVARMERDGLLHLDDERHIHLTEQGAAIATDVMRKHRLAERHLLDTIGLEYALVHDEACRWEHVMSAEVERLVAQRLSPPYVDPYGNPIPGLAELGIDADAPSAVDGATGATPAGQAIAKPLVTLSELDLANGGARVRLDRIGERTQSEIDLLRDLARHGIVAGAILAAELLGGELRLAAEGHEALIVPRDVASQLTVEPAPAG
ncbi:metal-dependent transcriptional regulator [Brachybacterium huguangmaarense]